MKKKMKRIAKKLSKTEFAKKLVKALGDSHEGRHLTTDLTDEFYKDYCASEKSFKEWFRAKAKREAWW